VSSFKLPKECARGACHVYLIEDDADLRFHLGITLEEAGLNVHAFASAEGFLEHGIEYSPSVIVSDMVLPGASGIHLFQAVRDLGIETPLVFISGYSEPNQIIEGMKLGAVDFLWKPFKSEALLQAVAQSLTLDVQRHAQLSQAMSLEQRWSTLSDREKTVCRLMLKGHGNKDISAQLFIQPDTANKHRMKVMKKMAVAGRPELIELLKNFEPAQIN
jgi:FixJ family two-component response regulator